MGFSNGTSKAHKTVEKGQQGERGIRFSLTADNHFHIRNKRLTNVAAPVDERDTVTKKFVTDLLKTKAGTTYVSNELGKKANKKDLNVTNPFLFLKRTTHSNKNIAKFSTGLSDQINQPPGKNGVINSDYWSLVNGELLIKKNWGI